jgi:hypothetical protein
MAEGLCHGGNQRFGIPAQRVASRYRPMMTLTVCCNTEALDLLLVKKRYQRCFWRPAPGVQQSANRRKGVASYMLDGLICR